MVRFSVPLALIAWSSTSLSSSPSSSSSFSFVDAWTPSRSIASSRIRLNQRQYEHTREIRSTYSVLSLLQASSTSTTESNKDDVTTSENPSSDDKKKHIILYNSLSRSKEPFQTLVPNKVSMYTCGPTVYDFAHVGNFRAFLTYDVMKRMLLYFGYDIEHICNLTDVDDKIITRATEQEIPIGSITDLTEKYSQLFLDDLDALNIIRANNYPKATEHITEMMDMILELHENDLAYETPDGSWYFATQNKPGYGDQLVNLNWDEMESSDRETIGEEYKKHPQDFCLWKAYKPDIDRMDAIWESSEIKKGRPGWHLECSAMSRKYLGDQIDLHGGGVDLKFPHHENEIAQSEGVLMKRRKKQKDDNANDDGTTIIKTTDSSVVDTPSCGRFCTCWFHNGFVNINDEKMSKSLGNFLTLRTACPTPIDVRAYRYLVVTSQYRNPLSFTKQAMDASKSAIKRIDKVRSQLDDVLEGSSESSSSSSSSMTDDNNDSDIASKVVPQALQNFEAALLDDLSMPRAAASLFGLIKAAEKEFKRVAKSSSSNDDKDDTSSLLDLIGLDAISKALNEMDKIFGIFYQVPTNNDTTIDGSSSSDDDDDDTIPEEVLLLVVKRTDAKTAKDWDLADTLRSQITDLGYTVKDVKGGEPIVSRIEV